MLGVKYHSVLMRSGRVLNEARKWVVGRILQASLDEQMGLDCFEHGLDENLLLKRWGWIRLRPEDVFVAVTKSTESLFGPLRRFSSAAWVIPKFTPATMVSR